MGRAHESLKQRKPQGYVGKKGGGGKKLFGENREV